MSNWHWQKSEERCPRCGEQLLWADDPDQESWGSTVEFRCSSCTYSAISEQQLEMDSYGDDDYDAYDDYEEVGE